MTTPREGHDARQPPGVVGVPEPHDARVDDDDLADLELDDEDLDAIIGGTGVPDRLAAFRSFAPPPSPGGDA